MTISLLLLAGYCAIVGPLSVGHLLAMAVGSLVWDAVSWAIRRR